MAQRRQCVALCACAQGVKREREEGAGGLPPRRPMVGATSWRMSVDAHVTPARPPPGPPCWAPPACRTWMVQPQGRHRGWPWARRPQGPSGWALLALRWRQASSASAQPASRWPADVRLLRWSGDEGAIAFAIPHSSLIQAKSNDSRVQRQSRIAAPAGSAQPGCRGGTRASGREASGTARAAPTSSC